MRILITSPAFLPSLGGLELATASLAGGLSALGHEVVVVTTTPGPADECAYRIVRRPSAHALHVLARWCDVYYQANVSLRLLWPLLLVRRPWVVSHHTWYRQHGGRRALRDWLKILLVRRAAASIAVSHAIAADLGGRPTVIENGYRDRLFTVLAEVARDRELVFVGRLVSDKGCDLLLDALGRLEAGVSLTVVGDGPDRQRLEQQAAALGLGSRVEFLGALNGEPLVRILNAHEVLVVPSRYREPFGIVALEGIACGCVVVASEGGGLKDAVGPCGQTFPNGNITALAARLVEILADGELRARCRAAAPAHLQDHREAVVIGRYEQVLEGVLRRG